ncbi:unnamed protein product [Miscanthus lutarioriparius]|uniref:HIT domain-containing protein n=1 Tax=Miscanthus lutarioriparius TaxID=422564 RepID=A0A811RJW2_9POAL|nr:unnamed protein product [Miscanthus lutarioriparius]
MPRPSGSPAPAPERRLAVLLSHFHPCCEPPRTIPGVASAECLGTAAAAEAETEGSLSTSPCAAGEEKGESSGAGRCVFCNIVAGTVQAFKLYEDDMCLCILDAKPLTSGHSLIIPKSHYPSLQTTPPTTHVHIIPRSKDDNLWSAETYSRNPISHGQETKHLVSSIKEIISSSPKDCSTVMSSTPKEL